MNLEIPEIILFSLIGFINPIISESLTSRITSRANSKAKSPKEMLYAFYQSRTLKLTLQIICLLSTLQLAPMYATPIVCGTVCGIISQRFILYKNSYEQKPAYTH